MEKKKTSYGVMSLEERLTEILTCSVCLDLLKDPRTLPCQHSFCFECLKNVVVGHSNVPCPHCRADFIVPCSGVQTLPTNSCLNSVLDLLGEDRRKRKKDECLLGAVGGVDVCSAAEATNSAVCSRCKNPCTNCEVKQLQNLESSLAEKVELLLIQSDEIKAKMESFEELCLQVQDRIRSEVTNRVRLLKDKESRLIELVDKIRDDGQKNCTEMLKRLEASTERIIELLSSDSEHLARISVSEKMALFLETSNKTTSLLKSAGETRLQTPTFYAETLSIYHPDHLDDLASPTAPEISSIEILSPDQDQEFRFAVENPVTSEL